MATPAATRRSRIPRLLLTGGALAAVAVAGAYLYVPSDPRPPSAGRPDILLVTIDTLRADRLGSYGSAAGATPELDALAAAGVRFETATAHAPLTAPSHASLLTGLTPPRHGVRDNGQALAPGVPTLADALRAGGYATGAFVSGFPLDRRFGLARAFDEYDDRLPHGDDPSRAAYVERPGPATTAAALRWIDARPPDRPWFAWVHYFEPHAPYEPPEPLRARFAARPYDGEVAAVDAEVGALLRRIEARGSRARTLVFVTADHGESLGEHGEDTHGVFVYEATLRVPLIVAGPGVPAGVVARTMARGVDLAPTLLDLAGLRPAADVDGRSLRPALGGAAMSEEPAYAESLFTRLNLGWAPLHAWRSGRYKLVDAPRPELYDMAADPAEARDLAAQHADVVATMQRQLQAALTRASQARPATGAAGGPSAETAERLAALGYLGGGGAPQRASGRDPKDGIAVVNRLERAIAEARTRPQWAADELKAVLAADPDLPLARRYRAIALAAAGDAAGAVRELERVETSGAARPEDLVLKAECLRRVGRVEDAAATLQRVLQAEPGSAAALRGLGDLALARGDAAAAEGHYTRVLERTPEDVPARVKLGIVQARTGRLEAAVATLHAAVARDAANKEALLALGGALARGGRAAEAVPYFERAVAAGARSPAVLNGLGFARLESGDMRGALDALHESLSLDPRQADIAQAVADLRRQAFAARP